MLSLYTSWEKYYGAESASFPVVHGDFGCNVTCQACRDNSPRMTIGTPRLARTDSANLPGEKAGSTESYKLHVLLSEANAAHTIQVIYAHV